MKSVKHGIVFIGCALLLLGCVPRLGNIYKTPQVEGKLVEFFAQDTGPFVPVAGAKVYHQNYPDKAVYSDVNGSFVLPAVVETQISMLMPAHALRPYPIIIEKDSLSFIALSRSTLLMRSLEENDLGEIILPQSTHINNQMDSKSKWPCDLHVIKSLDQSIEIMQHLLSAVNNHSLKSDIADIYLAQNYNQSQQLLEFARASCRWNESSDEQQSLHFFASRKYFNAIAEILDKNSELYYEIN